MLRSCSFILSCIFADRDALFAFPALLPASSASPSSASPAPDSLPCTILLSQHKYGEMISGATGLAPMSSVITPQLLQQGAEFVRALNAAHQLPTSAVRVHFVMEFVTNRDCPQVDLSALPEGILLVCRENWE